MVVDSTSPCTRQFLRSVGAAVNLPATRPETHFPLEAALVQANWTSNTRCLMTATPSNPSSTLELPAELKVICDWVRSQRTPYIVDEVYRKLGAREAHRCATQNVFSFDPTYIVINSFSKYFGMAEWHQGW